VKTDDISQERKSEEVKEKKTELALRGNKKKKQIKLSHSYM
jgi:hypothetical protein